MVGQIKLMVRSWMASGLHTVLLVAAGMWLGAGLSSGAEVGGIYTEPTTKDLGEITKIDQQFPLMTYASYATMVANTSGECFDHPFPSFAEVFALRHDRLSC